MGTHIVLGPTALVLAVMYARLPAERPLSSVWQENPDPWQRTLDWWCMHCGEVVIGNLFYQTVFWVLRWETSVLALLHHLGFLVGGLVALSSGPFVLLIISACSMEVSSPFLSLHEIFRQLEGEWAERISWMAKMIFGATFILVRILFYGWQLVNFHHSFWTHPGLLPREMALPAAYVQLAAL